MRSHHVICFFPFYIAAQWLHVCSPGLLAKFSTPSRLSVSLALPSCLLSLDFFFVQLRDVWVEFLPLFHAIYFRGKVRDSRRGGHLLDLSKGRLIEGINKRGCLCFGQSVYRLSSQGSQTRRRKDVEKETKAERKWESNWRGGERRR